MWCAVTMLYQCLVLLLSLAVLYVLLFFVLCFKWSTPRRNYTMAKRLPGPRTVPILGMAVKLSLLKPQEMFGFVEDLVTKWKPLVAFRNIGYLCTLTVEPDHVEEILKSTKYISKGLEYFPILPWLGTGLLTSKGEKWVARRKMLTPTFHFEILEQYLPIINQNAMDLSEKLEKEVFTTINLIPFVSNLTLKIIVETAMGTKLHGKGGEEYIQAVNMACTMVIKRTQDPALFNDVFFYFSWAGYQARKALKTLHRFTENVIEERRKEYRQQKLEESESDGRRRKAFLDFLIEISEQHPDSMTNLDIREEVDTFMFEGHDTTAMGLCWTLFLLASNEDIQDKVVAEIESIFHSLDCGDIRQEHLRKMEYLEMVIKEALRLYPSVPYISRWLEHDLVLGEYTIPAQSNVGIMSYLLHRNPDIYPDPEKFDPERFSKENSANRHPFAYIPFSAGPRNCIGQRFAMMEEKVVLTQILSRYKLEAISKREEVQSVPHVVLRPVDNELLVRITKRN